ncbi:MAG: hypothetical protein WDZ76_10655 [Pseudohongiellaceae bacterium]
MTVITSVLWFPGLVFSQHEHHHHHGMNVDADGMVMNHNATELPLDCAEISSTYEFTVRVGTSHASLPGVVFGMSQHEFAVAPCSLVTINFVNEDEIRHQFMVHGLPMYLYPQGMFHLEAAGGTERSGSFIVPGDDQTYLIHCDMAQHMEKGMKAQLVVGAGSGDLWSVPGISQNFLNNSGLGTVSRNKGVLGALLVAIMAIMSFLVLLYLGKGEQNGIE